MEDVCTFYGRLVYLSYDHLVFLWPFGILYGDLVYISPFWYFVPRKIWQPWIRAKLDRSGKKMGWQDFGKLS
jgi:hypothetical protein